MNETAEPGKIEIIRIKGKYYISSNESDIEVYSSIKESEKEKRI